MKCLDICVDNSYHGVTEDELFRTGMKAQECHHEEASSSKMRLAVMGPYRSNARAACLLKRNIVYSVDEVSENLVNIAKVWFSLHSFIELHGGKF